MPDLIADTEGNLYAHPGNKSFVAICYALTTFLHSGEETTADEEEEEENEKTPQGKRKTNRSGNNSRAPHDA